MSSSSSSSPRYSVSEPEARSYYAGLPSNPRLVYRTGTTPWTEPVGAEAYRVLKELRPVFGHKLNAVWKDFGPKICDFLDSVGVLWTSIDVVRFIWLKEGETIGPVVLWVGVAPDTLIGKDAHTAAHGCLELLKGVEISDVEVEFRESNYTRLAGPNLLKHFHVSGLDPTINVYGPLTPALGLSISAQATRHIEGTGGFYLAEGGDSKKVLLVTARHVLFPLNKGPNVNYAYTPSRKAHNVLLLGTKAFDNFITSIKLKISGLCRRAEYYNKEIKVLQKREAGEEKDDHETKEVTAKRKELQKLLDMENSARDALDEFLGEVLNKWRPFTQRILGHIVCSPPITLGAGTEGYTEDYAVVELDSSKIKDAFEGNVIDLGKITSYDFKTKMSGKDTTITCPYDHLLKLQGLIQEDQMHHPDMTDNTGEPSLFVIKNSSSTGITIGRATGIFSFVREYFINGTHQTSTEWAILPYDHESGDFSAPGDSGSIIVDGHGHMGGLLTGGTGKTNSFKLDVTYATPLFWLLPRIKENGFPDAHLCPVMA